MPDMKILLDGDGAFPVPQTGKLHHVKTTMTVARLQGGMESGKSSVMFHFVLSNGDTVMAETSMTLFQSAARVFAAADESQPKGVKA